MVTVLSLSNSGKPTPPLIELAVKNDNNIEATTKTHYVNRDIWCVWRASWAADGADGHGDSEYNGGYNKNINKLVPGNNVRVITLGVPMTTSSRTRTTREMGRHTGCMVGR